ncbi:uncharacterized protein K460DRAFT_278749, partial [Cucurbitaria berberidis CBS 394.84]
MDEGTGNFNHPGFHQNPTLQYNPVFNNNSHMNRPKIIPAHDAWPNRRLSDEQAPQFYPVTLPDQAKDEPMLHPGTYLPPMGTFFNWNDRACVTPEGVGSFSCRVCFRLLRDHTPPVAKQVGFQCPRPCAFTSVLDHTPHPGTPCPQVWITSRSAQRKWNYNPRSGWYPGLQVYPSEKEWKILKANGYIGENGRYDPTMIPAFTDKIWQFR